MTRHIPLLIGVSLLSACAAVPASVTTSTPPSSDITQSIDGDVRTIDGAFAADYVPETKQDVNQKETATAYRESGVIRKVSVVRASDAEASEARYYFNADGALFYAKVSGARMHRNSSGYLDTVTNLDAMYYFEKGVLVAVRSASGYLLQGTAAEEHEEKANAAEAVSRFAR